MARRIFLSFAFEDQNQVRGFRLLRWNTNVESDFFDSSLLTPVQSQDVNYIMQSIRNRMDNTSVTVVLIGPTTHKSAWVDWEIKETVRRGNGLLGIRLKGHDYAVPPAALSVPRARVGNWSPEQFDKWIEDAARLAGK